MVKINQNSVFIVSGGGRGMTNQCVIRLAQISPCNFILLGRSQLVNEPEWANNITNKIELKKQAFAYFNSQKKKTTPREINQLIKSILASREIKKTLQTVRDLGAKTEYLSVDITDVNLPNKIAPIAEKFGQITGIIHGAGILADKLIENKTEQDFERVYATKVDGLYNLLNCVNSEQLKHLILFSSAAGFYGNIGQSDYALANEILNKFAHQFKHQYPKCQVISFNWGPWESGMVTPELKAIFKQRGVEVIPVDVGTKIFVNQIINGNNDQVQILVGGGLIHPSVELQSELKTHRLKRKLTLENNPFLQDHVIGNHPVLPAFFANLWIANTFEQMYLGYKFFSCKKFKLLKGIVFDETLADEYILELKEINKIPNQEIELSAVIWSETNQGKKRYHYESHITLLKQIPERPIYEKFDNQQDDKLINLSPYEDGTLFHGFSFQGVKKVLNISNQKITLECIFPQVRHSQFGQFPPQSFNAFGLDSVFQCMLIWARYFYQAASLPAYFQKCEHFQDIPCGQIFYASMEVKQHNSNKLIADVVLHDQQGKIYSRILGAEVSISKQLNHLFLSIKDRENEQRISFWRGILGIKHPVAESLYTSLYKHFVGEIIIEDVQDFHSLNQQPRLYFANHQVAIESILFIFAVSALSDSVINTVAKIEHQKTWLSELSNQIYAYPRLKDPQLIFYFDRNNQISMFKLLKAIKKVIVQQQRSLLVHIEGTRSLSCRQPVTDLSAVFLDLALELNIPIIPVKFVGGLPIQPLEQRLEFPFRYTSQNYHLGKAIYPQHLQKLGNVERKNLILARLNELGVNQENSFPHQPNLSFEKEVYSWMQKTGVSEIYAVLYKIFERIPNPPNEVQALLKIITDEEVKLSDSPEDNWLREFARWLRDSNIKL